MKSTTEINFTYRCRKNSAGIQLVQGKKFCELCQTNIIDLKLESTEKIQHILALHDGQICGEFFLDQLDNSNAAKKRSGISAFIIGITAIFSLNTTKAVSQLNTTTNFEQHETTSISLNEDLISPNLDSKSITTSEKQLSPYLMVPDSKRKKEFFKIGRRHFYTSAGFPFIISKKSFRGRLISNPKF